MDTLTHALSGALAARLMTRPAPGAVPGWQRTAAGMVAAAFPDIDFVLSFISPLFYLLHHRGATHSVLLLPLWAFLLAWLSARIFRNPAGWRPYLAICAVGLALHILGDLVTSFGTMILSPLSDVRVAWNTTFIIDLWLSGIILAGLAASVAWRRSRVPAALAALALAGYVAFQWQARNEAIGVGERYARSQGIADARVTALPRPLSPANWTVIVADGGNLRYAHVNLRRDDVPAPAAPEASLFARIQASYRPPASAIWLRASRFGSGDDAALARAAWNDRAFAFFRWFADYPALLRVDRNNPSTCVWFHDLRFENPGTERDLFRMGLCREGEGPWSAYRLESEGVKRRLE